MGVSAWGRLAPWAGIAFVVLIIAGIILLTDSPDNDASDQQWKEYLADSGAHVRNIIGYYIWAVAAMTFVLFLVRLYGVLRRAEGESGMLSRVALAAGLLFVAALMSSGAAIAAVPGAIELGDTPAPAPDFARMLPQIGFGLLLVGGGFAAITMIIATSILTLRTKVFPTWIAWLGFVAAVVLLFAALALPMVALLVWIVAVAILLTRRPAGPIVEAA